MKDNNYEEHKGDLIDNSSGHSTNLENETDNQINENLENESEIEQEEQEYSKPEIDYRTKFKHERDKKRALYAERIQLSEHNKQLRELVEQALNTSSAYKGSDLENKMQIAIAEKLAAVESNDKQALIEADLKITNLSWQINEFEKNWNQNKQHSTNEDNYNNTIENDYYESDQEYKQELYEDWVNRNKEIQPKSSKFDREVYKGLENFVNRLNKTLVNNNQQDQIGTEDYYDILDRCITGIKQNNIMKSKNTTKVSSMNVGGVRNYIANKSPNKSYLSNEDKEAASRFGMSEADFLKYRNLALKSKDNRENK